MKLTCFKKTKTKTKNVYDRKLKLGVTWSGSSSLMFLGLSCKLFLRCKLRAVESMLGPVSPGSEVPWSFSYRGNMVYISAMKQSVQSLALWESENLWCHMSYVHVFNVSSELPKPYLFKYELLIRLLAWWVQGHRVTWNQKHRRNALLQPPLH